MLADLIIGSWGYLAAALAAVGFVIFRGRAKKREGREEVYIEALKDRAEREEKGREAVSDLRGADRDDLADRVRRNDGLW